MMVPFQPRRQRAYTSAKPTPPTFDERALLSQMAAGDEDALGPMIDHYGPQLVRYLTGRFVPYGTAEELMIETMLRLWQHADDLIATWRSNSVKAWLYRVAYHAAIDVLRKKDREGTADPLDARVLEGLVSTDPAVDSFAAKDWQHQEVHESMAALPTCYRDTLHLIYFEGLTYQDTAFVLGVPMGTVKSRVNYGLRRLKTLLQKRGVDGTC